MAKRKRPGEHSPPFEHPPPKKNAVRQHVLAPTHISAMQRHRIAYQHRMRQEEQAAMQAIHAEQDINDLAMRIGESTLQPNKRQHASHGPVQSKRRKTQDPLDTSLNNIERIVQTAHMTHRLAHHLKFLIHTVRQSRLSEAQEHRLGQLLAAIQAKGWRMPNVRDHKSLKF